MKAFVNFLVNKKRVQEEQKEATRIHEEEQKRAEEEIEEKEIEEPKKRTTNLLSKITAGVTGNNDQSNQVLTPFFGTHGSFFK